MEKTHKLVRTLNVYSTVKNLYSGDLCLTSLTPVFHTGNLVIDPVWGNHPSVQPREVKVYPVGEPNSNMFQCAVKFLVLPPDVLPVVFFSKGWGGLPWGWGRSKIAEKPPGY